MDILLGSRQWTCGAASSRSRIRNSGKSIRSVPDCVSPVQVFRTGTSSAVSFGSCTNLLNTAQMTIRLYSICEKALKIVRTHVPDFSELKCGQLATASHALDLFGAAIENLRQIMNVQHTLFAVHATLLRQRNSGGKGVCGSSGNG